VFVALVIRASNRSTEVCSEVIRASRSWVCWVMSDAFSDTKLTVPSCLSSASVRSSSSDGMRRVRFALAGWLSVAGFSVRLSIRPPACSVMVTASCTDAIGSSAVIDTIPVVITSRWLEAISPVLPSGKVRESRDSPGSAPGVTVPGLTTPGSARPGDVAGPPESVEAPGTEHPASSSALRSTAAIAGKRFMAPLYDRCRRLWITIESRHAARASRACAAYTGR